MGGYFSSPGSIQDAATANEYRVSPNYFSGSNASSGAPATRRNRRNSQMGGAKKSRKNRNRKTRRR